MRVRESARERESCSRDAHMGEQAVDTVLYSRSLSGYSTSIFIAECIQCQTHTVQETATPDRRLPNWSFFMAATYLSSRDRRTDSGFGRQDVLLEDSAIFLSGGGERGGKG